MKNKTLTLYIAIITWAIAFFSLGMYCAKADLVMDSYANPAYAAMPQNLYHNTIYGNKSGNTKFDQCKTPGSVRKILVDKSDKTMQLLDINGCVEFNSYHLAQTFHISHFIAFLILSFETSPLL